ncbi:hypothetical protein [Streptomyces sp. NPDC001292]
MIRSTSPSAPPGAAGSGLGVMIKRSDMLGGAFQAVITFTLG